jgi:glutamyl/glutaminyl-tRNA synthetase
VHGGNVGSRRGARETDRAHRDRRGRRPGGGAALSRDTGSPTAPECCRFAPTTSGPAHPGTLLAGLLCWLDARSRGASIELRLEDIDHTRCTPESARDLRAALDWFGLDWDSESLQSEQRRAHGRALDRLARCGRLYPCRCSRSAVKRSGTLAADGGHRYPGTCRERRLPATGWRDCGEALRLRLEPGLVEPLDEGGVDLAQDPAAAMGDPILRRLDGAVAYHLAVVVDDAEQAVTRVVRGRDLASSTAIHVVLQRLLDLPTPVYRHHLLLLEEHGDKLAKLHGAVGWHELQEHYSPERLCGLLAWLAGLRPTDAETRPRELLSDFDWGRVRRDDQALRWSGGKLVHLGSGS